MGMMLGKTLQFGLGTVGVAALLLSGSLTLADEAGWRELTEEEVMLREEARESGLEWARQDGKAYVCECSGFSQATSAFGAFYGAYHDDHSGDSCTFWGFDREALQQEIDARRWKLGVPDGRGTFVCEAVR